MSDNIDLRSRLVGNGRGSSGGPLYAYACGHSGCDEDAVFQARLVGRRANGEKVYAFASECHFQPDEYPTVAFVLKDEWPPFGVTDVLRFKFYLSNFPFTAQCLSNPDDPCPSAYLIFDGVDSFTGTMDGTLGTVNISVQLTGSIDPDTGRGLWRITLSGCFNPPVTVDLHRNCDYPLSLGGQGFTIDPDCCVDHDVPAATDVAVLVEGFTNRALPARYVGRQAGEPLYATSHCCPVDPNCVLAHCCLCDATAYQWGFTISGVTDSAAPPPPPHACTCVNGDWVVTFLTFGTDAQCQWRSVLPACGTWILRCLNVDNTYHLDFDGTLGAGGAAHYVFDDPGGMAAWDCLGPNVMTLSSATSLCENWPTSIIISPV